MEYPNWFVSSAQNNFEMYLAEFADKPDLKFLQIGAFTGDASLWMCENILTNYTSTLTDVDTWLGSNEEQHEDLDFDNVYETYIEKIAPFRRVVRLRMTSREYFTGGNSGGFDFIYIDGDHTASGVIDDAIMSWPLLKSGGIMAFDDYIWHHADGDLYTPKPSINFFLWVKQGQLELMEANNQVWIRKI